jgi:hypothetical protein
MRPDEEEDPAGLTALEVAPPVVSAGGGGAGVVPPMAADGEEV